MKGRGEAVRAVQTLAALTDVHDKFFKLLCDRDLVSGFPKWLSFPPGLSVQVKDSLLEYFCILLFNPGLKYTL